MTRSELIQAVRSQITYYDTIDLTDALINSHLVSIESDIELDLIIFEDAKDTILVNLISRETDLTRVVSRLIKRVESIEFASRDLYSGIDYLGFLEEERVNSINHYYSLRGNNLYIYPEPSGGLETTINLEYELEPLGPNPTDTNQVLTKYPNLYVYKLASRIANVFVEDDAISTKFEKFYKDYLDKVIEREEERTRMQELTFHGPNVFDKKRSTQVYYSFN